MRELNWNHVDTLVSDDPEQAVRIIFLAGVERYEIPLSVRDVGRLIKLLIKSLWHHKTLKWTSR